MAGVDPGSSPDQVGAGARVWSTFGPHAIGAERFLAVCSGLRRYIVRPGRRCHPGETSPGAEPW